MYNLSVRSVINEDINILNSSLKLILMVGQDKRSRSGESPKAAILGGSQMCSAN